MRNRFRLPKIANFPPKTITEAAPARNSAIIFQGHSLADDFLRDAFRSWNTQASVTADVQQCILAGTSENLWLNSASANGVNSATYLVSPGTDLFVYVEASPFDALDGDINAQASPVEFGNEWAQLAWANGAKPYLYLAWPTTLTGTDPYQTTTGLSNGDPAPTMAWRPKLDYMRQHYEAIIGRAEALRPTNAPRFRAIPADRLMARLYDMCLAGNLLNVSATASAFYTRMFSDDINLTNYGKYAIACLHYACLYQRSPIGLSTSWTDELSAAYTSMPTTAEALQLQQVALTIASSDKLSAWGQQVPADPYEGQTPAPSSAEWYTPATPAMIIPLGPPWGFPQCTLAWSYRYSAGQLDAPPTTQMINSDMFTGIFINGHNDSSGRSLACGLVSSGWANATTNFVSPTPHLAFPGGTNNFVFVFDAAGGLTGGATGATGQIWHNGVLVIETTTTMSDISLAGAYFMGDRTGTYLIPGQTQGYWWSNDTAVPAATIYADLFDGANGLRDLGSPVVGGVTPDAYQFGPP